MSSSASLRCLPAWLACLVLVGCAGESGSLAGGAGSGLEASGATEAADGRLFMDLGVHSGLARSPRRAASSEFWSDWGDGRAEMSGYRVTVTHYGEPREGELSLIYVTEPHDRRTWIKDDGVEAPDRVEVLKLIRSLQFLTGIYPYSIMASTFSPVDVWWPEERFRPVRINLDVQEWCGSVTHRVWPGPDRLRSLRLSYFASEGETLREVDLPQGTLFEDALLIQLRELDGPFHEGGDWSGWLVPELWRLRTGRGPIEPVEARITRSRATREGVPVTRFVLDAGDYRRTFDVEEAEPRRVLGWESSSGERAELLETERLAYWSLNRAGDERYRAAMGLSPAGTLPPGLDGAACAAVEMP